MARAVFLALLASGCASVQGTSCGDSYEAGRADAMFGRQANVDAYARACPQASAADYLAGWRIGASETSFRQPN
jgi:hypothetical protein